MTASNIALLIAALGFAILFLQPRLLRSQLWQATVTPLASIIGSGFLAAGPILAHAAGRWAALAMLGLCSIAYLFGSAIRHNIVHVEPEFADSPGVLVAGIERASEIALSLAYFVSVAYYLNLFAAFGLRLGDIIDPFWIRVVSTLVIATVGILGLRGGLDALERLTLGAVSIKLALIGALLTALLVATLIAMHTGTFDWPALQHARGTHELRMLLGLVILVQGFETSRYLGSAYDANTRVRTMRWAQWLSTAIYLTFMLLITRYFSGNLPAEGGETAIIDMLAPLGALVMPVIVIMALASQLSAAVADTSGAGGLIAESTSKRMPVNIGHLVTALAAIAITWLADIYQIITYASQAFVAYYALQSLQAMLSAWKLGRKWRAAIYAVGIVIALVVVVFAVPAEG
ncbi:hypothetical protein [Thermomonas sp.]|uniref:hypothetical protein n=1 Tax=Thermomonas sp. TaxID=1971895 RepID=UPI0024878D62|nr:hypothetical protein [Thermomonas sp.]MDI1252682.1 hypothetical protein [Thermomonas sp.]